MVHTSLKDAATMAVCCDFHAVSCHGIINELVILRRELVQTLLDYVIPVQVLDQGHYVHSKGDNDRVNLHFEALVSLTRGRQEIDHLLDSSRAVHVQGDVDKVLSDRSADLIPLFIGRVFE